METETPDREDDPQIHETPTEADETPDGGDAPTEPQPDADPDRGGESPAQGDDGEAATQSRVRALGERFDTLSSPR